MAKRKQITDVELPPPNLLIPREEASKRIKNRLKIGLKIQDLDINNSSDLESARAQRNKWHDFNIEMLSRIFDNNSIADEYKRSGAVAFHMRPSFAEQVGTFRERINKKIIQLESINERLELIPEPIGHPTPIPAIEAPSPSSKDIFVVHGHDEAAKESVSRYLDKLELNPIILHEQPNKGQTLIEKLESNAAIVGFAVVLLTHDDDGYPKNKPEETKPRARQNVIIELGLFMGKLGRAKVCALYKEGVEIPSDYKGVVYILMDSAGAWRLALAREIKEAKIPIDMNNAI